MKEDVICFLLETKGLLHEVAEYQPKACWIMAELGCD